MNKELLRRFLVEAGQKGYASGRTEEWHDEADDSKTIVYCSGDFRVHDNYFGGEPYGGREIVFYQNKPVWIMVYYGWICDPKQNHRVVYTFLQRAMRADPEAVPLRGPKKLVQGEWRYETKWKGDIERFSGEEIIYKKSREAYRAWHAGGLVDQRYILDL